MIPPWLDRTEHVLLRVLQVLLAVSAVGVVVIGTLMIVNMNASERSQGGAVYVGIGMLVLLGVIVGKLASVSARLKSRRGDHATGRIERSHASDGVPRTQCITEASMTQAMIGPMGMLALAGLLAFVI